MENLQCKTPLNFFEWAKHDSTAITYLYISVQDYERSETFLKAVCNNIKPMPGTMKVHTVHATKPNSVWVCDTSCFCRRCFNISFQSDNCYDEWKKFSVIKTTDNEKSTETKPKHRANNTKVNTEEVEETVEPNVNNYVAAVYDHKVG